MCCYLYRKRSNVININAEAKEQGRDMQTLIDDSGIFIEVSRSAQLPPSPCWSPSQGIPRKGQAPGRVTPWIASVLPHAQVGIRRAFRQASPGWSLSQNRPIYKSTSTKTIAETIKFSHLSPYKPGSQLKPRRISNQLAYNQDHSNST